MLNINAEESELTNAFSYVTQVNPFSVFASPHIKKVEGERGGVVHSLPPLTTFFSSKMNTFSSLLSDVGPKSALYPSSSPSSSSFSFLSSAKNYNTSV
jgi:hypothetical protein